MRCIVCGGETRLARRCTYENMRNALERYFLCEIDKDVEIGDYDILKCDDCGLEFSDPRTPGSGEFYRWITSQQGYYPEDRWEFAKVEKAIHEGARNHPVRVLDVGCGSGDFLSRLFGTKNVEVHGLDTTPQSVEACLGKGIQAYCCDIETFRRDHPSLTFDYVVSFHCIEHVPDPKLFVSEMASLLTDKGELLVSAPLSPMCFETSWFDPLNHPPHHLSRFSAVSLQSLAQAIGFRVDLVSSPPWSIVKSAIRTIKLCRFGPCANISKVGLLLYVVFHAPLSLREIYKQYLHRHNRGSLAGDTFLASFRRELDQKEKRSDRNFSKS